jgi:formylglycine-generating enzyme required for sulfatase activity
MHQRKEFDRLTLTPTVGEQVVEIRYGIGTIALADVPPGCVARINGERVNTQFSCPIRIGSTLAVSLVVVDATMVEVYTESLVLSPNESKKVTVPSLERTPVDGVSPADSTTPVEPQLAIETRASQSLLTRRLVIGGGIAGVLSGGGVLFYLRTQTPFLRYVNTMRPIPSGNFLMGSSTGNSDEKPIHNVTLSAFRLGSTPVTVAVWKEYCAATGTKVPEVPSWGLLDDHPVVNVSWNDIIGSDGKSGFCAWASAVAGFRLTLPTEAQFEYAALGGQSGLEYPWGNTFDDSKLWCSAKTSRSRTAPVVRSSSIFSKHPYDLTDMAGNVWQWCSDSYEPYTGTEATNPVGSSTSSDNTRCVRGGSWSSNYPDFFRCAFRYWDLPEVRDYNVGFRLSAGSV